MGIPQCFPSPASKSGGEALSSVSHVRTLVAVMGVADRWDMVRRFPKFVTDVAGKNCTKAFHGRSGSGDTGSPRDVAAQSCLCPRVQRPEASVLRPALQPLKRHRGQWPLAILQHMLRPAAKPAGRSDSWAENVLWDLSKTNS